MEHKGQTREGIGTSAGAHLIVHGRVQGVGYRFFTQDLAESLGLGGWVRNLPDGDVEVYLEGTRAVIEGAILQLKKGPPVSRVEHISVDWQSPQNAGARFSIY